MRYLIIALLVLVLVGVLIFDNFLFNQEPNEVHISETHKGMIIEEDGVKYGILNFTLASKVMTNHTFYALDNITGETHKDMELYIPLYIKNDDWKLLIKRRNK